MPAVTFRILVEVDIGVDLKDGMQVSVKADVKDPADGVEVLGQAIVGHRLNQHQRACRLDPFANVAHRPDWVAHLMQCVAATGALLETLAHSPCSLVAQ
jgi:hypothetical protein